MNEIALDILSHVGDAEFIESDEYLEHYGMPRRSGRFPWGSGDHPYQSAGDFYSSMKKSLRDGASKKELAAAVGMSTADFTLAYSISEKFNREELRDKARKMADSGMSKVEIGKALGMADTSVGNLLRSDETARKKNQPRELAELFKEQLEKKGVIDIGKGVENTLGVSRNKLDEAIFILEAENNQYFHETQRFSRPESIKPGRTIEYMLLCKSDEALKAAKQDPSKIGLVQDMGVKSDDGGETFRKLQYPASVSSDRIAINYADTGTGEAYDGMIMLRRGVPDLNLGDSHYAQVRIMVDDSHYLKGMAVYSDNIPDGKDIVFNTNKKSNVPLHEVLKKKKDDELNPFGAAITVAGQSTYIGKDGKEHLSPINKLNSEGSFDTAQSKNLSSQFLGKQNQHFIETQLALTQKTKEAQFENIKKLTNPAVRQKKLNDFADACDSAAVDLKAIGVPGQMRSVILSVPSLKPHEVYAPNFDNGQKLALVRYPHAGPFEIPILTVNNKNAEGKDIMGTNPKDAIGIHPTAAARLSGADFDGDTVICLPTDNGTVKSQALLKGLQGFDPKNSYSSSKYTVKDKNGEEKTIYVNDKTGKKFKPITETEKNKQMGIVSNLITDMYLQGANSDEVTRAVRHSMVVIDSEKHKLDYKQSEKDHDVKSLVDKYQKAPKKGTEFEGTGGATTLLSLRKTTVDVPERMGAARINPDTGEKYYKESGRKYYNKAGDLVPATSKEYRVLLAEDVTEVGLKTKPEMAYGAHANYMKDLGRRARLEALRTPNLKYDPEAAKIYSKEVKELESQLEAIKRDKPLMRQVAAVATTIVRQQKSMNEEMTKDEEKKMRTAARNKAKEIVGAQGTSLIIKPTPKQWEAIQAGAMHHTKVLEILDNSDAKYITDLAMPKDDIKLSKVEINRIQSLANSGYTNAEIADLIGCSKATVTKHIK